MINHVHNLPNLTLMQRMRAERVRFDLCYADMMFDEKTCDELAWLSELHTVAKSTATLYVHTDQRSVCEVKHALRLAGWHLQSWIIWPYNWGGRPRRLWAPKHDDILMATLHPKHYTFNAKAVAIPKKTLINSLKDWQIPTDVWSDIGMLHTMSKEKDRGEHRKWQKPEALLERIVLASSNVNDLVFDPFAGTGTSLVAAKRHGRRYLGCDIDKNAVRIAQTRLRATQVKEPT